MKKGRLPDFAGVALVDILANGLAMLIIVIVLSIAARAEHETRTTAQVEEVETMMSRRFSTSLVLNSLAASPPARLHDYHNSPLDQVHDPQLLPILELHRGFVREYYTGAVWSRAELLREGNAMDAWLAGFDEDRKLRLRVDVYDIAQFYLTMSILRDHGIIVRHWHFRAGGLEIAQAGRCPPGVAAEDCEISAVGDSRSNLPKLGAGSGDGDGEGKGDGKGKGEGDGDSWPPRGFPEKDGGGLAGGGTGAGPFPGNAVLGGGGAEAGEQLGGGSGSGRAGQAGGLGAGSFPNARPGLGGKSRGLLGGGGGGPPSEGVRFRLSSPESLRDPRAALGSISAMPSREQVLAVLLDFTGKLQATLDSGASPSALLENFEAIIRRSLAAPPVPDGADRELIDALMVEIAWADLDVGEEEFLGVTHQQLPPRASTALIVEPNRLLRGVVVGRAEPSSDDVTPSEKARPLLRLNAHPDVWRGLSLSLERNALLLLPPQQQRPNQSRWRALAYIAPDFDDFIIGFAYAAVDSDGRLVVQGEDNRVRLDGRPLHTPYRAALFGARSWLVALYAGLALCFLGFLLAVRRLALSAGANARRHP